MRQWEACKVVWIVQTWRLSKNACSILDEYIDVVTSYISSCEDLCVPPKNVHQVWQ